MLIVSEGMRLPSPTRNPTAPRTTDTAPETSSSKVRSCKSWGIGKSARLKRIAAYTNATASATINAANPKTPTRSREGRWVLGDRGLHGLPHVRRLESNKVTRLQG